MTTSFDLVVGHVDPSRSRDAYYWHRGFAATDAHIFPRSWKSYEALADNWQVFAALKGDGDFAGLTYYAKGGNEWEVGGLMVDQALQGIGLGSTLMRVTLGHLLFDEDPLGSNETVIAHVHKDNSAPRSIIHHSLAFRFRRAIQVSGTLLPGLKTDSKGLVHGDEFELAIPETLEALAKWCDAWNSQLGKGHRASISLREFVTLADWAKAFRQMASST